MDPDDRDHQTMVAALCGAARTLLDEPDVHDVGRVLERVVAAARDVVPGCDRAGLTVVRRDRAELPFPPGTADGADPLDRLQVDLQEGPGVTAARSLPPGELLPTGELGGDAASGVWPRFAPRAVQAGCRSMLSVAICAEPSWTAAVNLYAAAPHTFGARDRAVAAVFGTQAALLLRGADRSAQLERALDTRDMIGQAKGILRERFDVDDEQAFRMLVASSQHANLKLAEVARRLIAR